MHFADELEFEDRRERRFNELARIENILRKREAEIREMDAVLADRRRELEAVVHQVGKDKLSPHYKMKQTDRQTW